MRKLLRITLVVLCVFIALGITSCDDECSFCTPASFCDFDELRENTADSTCLAEDFLGNFGCPNARCSSRNPDIRVGNSDTCTVIDCETISCEDLIIETFDPEKSMIITESASGFITGISTLEETGLPTGVFEVGDLMGEFRCQLFVP